MIADMSNADNRVAAFARVGTINMAANMSGPLLAGVLADLLGILSAYLMLVVVFAIMTAFVSRIREPPRERKTGLENTVSPR